MSKRAKKGAVTAAPAPPGPILVVTATVTVMPTDDGGGDVHVKVDVEGLTALVGAMSGVGPSLDQAGRELRAVVMAGLGLHLDGLPVDLLALSKRAGRA